MKKKQILFTIGIVVLMLALTNPSNKDFEGYLNSHSYKIGKYIDSYYSDPFIKMPFQSTGSYTYEIKYGKYSNYLLFSIFYYNCSVNLKEDSLKCEKYIGVLKNFYKYKKAISKRN